jgi:hypothetical protein
VAKIVTTIRKKQKTELGVKATRKYTPEYEESKVEDEPIDMTKRIFWSNTKCLLETATVWSPTSGGANND